MQGLYRCTLCIQTIRLPCRYAREDALGKLGGAVAEGAQLIEDLYQAFYQELQKPLASAQAGPNQPVKDSTNGQSSRGAHESPQNEAAAKVTWQQDGTAPSVGRIPHFWRVNFGLHYLTGLSCYS